jgi:tRNA dimethylallyltransferase
MTGAQRDWKSQVTEFLQTAKNPLLVVLGPTASGKTAFSISLASFLQDRGSRGEVVNADSRQLYRGLDIGTAKVTKEERKDVPHHLLDVLDPPQEATAGWYQAQASTCIGDIRRRGNIPLLVGGSMLYLSTVIDGLTLGPPTDSALRLRLLAEYDKDEGATLYGRLAEMDPESAAAIDRRNKPYVVRAMEIHELLQSSATPMPRDELRAGDALSAGHDLLIFGLTRPREELYARINERCEAMFAAGWVEEVRSLLSQGYTEADPGMKSHGYREIIRFLKEKIPFTEKALMERIATKTRQYAKRQMIWWKGDGRIAWL